MAGVEMIEFVVVKGGDVFGEEVDWFDGETNSAARAFEACAKEIVDTGEKHSVMQRIRFVPETSILSEVSEAETA